VVPAAREISRAAAQPRSRAAARRPVHHSHS